jgi:Flp pilus assembly protein TadG
MDKNRGSNLSTRRGPGCLGSSTIETALALIIAFPIIFAAFELCIFTYAQAALSDAVRTGVRYAIVHGADSSTCSGPSQGCQDASGANVVSTVQATAGQYLTSLSAANVVVQYPDGSSSPPSRVVVTASYTYLPIFSAQSMAHTMHATAGGRIVY